jgi:hypothetical protein
MKHRSRLESALAERDRDHIEALQREEKQRGLIRDGKLLDLDQTSRPRPDSGGGITTKAKAKGVSGGGSKGREREKKKGTWVCGTCHLEYCEHRPKRSGKGGRPSKYGANPRRHFKGSRVSDLDLTTLYELGLSTSDALALFGIAYRERRPLEEVIAEYRDAFGIKKNNFSSKSTTEPTAA